LLAAGAAAGEEEDLRTYLLKTTLRLRSLSAGIPTPSILASKELVPSRPVGTARPNQDPAFFGL
jgi:hypothetical protein